MYITGLPAVDSALISDTQNTTIDKDAFLQLLTVQLQYQDPTDPLDTNQMTAQMTNFAILSQLQEIHTNLANFFDAQIQFAAIGMLGKELSVKDSEGNTIQGTVQSLRFSSEGPMVKVDGVEYALSQIQEISKE